MFTSKKDCILRHDTMSIEKNIKTLTEFLHHTDVEVEVAFNELVRLARIGATLEEKRFPIQGEYDNPKAPHGWVPWEIGMRAYAVWAKSYGGHLPDSEEYQNGKGIADRGGFGYYEMDLYTGSTEWRGHFRASR